jgi:hypothetical protein
LRYVTHVDRRPGDATERLSHCSNGLFIWARIARTFISDGYNPCKRLEQVWTGTRLTDSAVELDALYTIAVKIGMLDGDEDNSRDNVIRVWDVDTCATHNLPTQGRLPGVSPNRILS